MTALLAAAVTGHVETIATLVARGANLDYETQLQVSSHSTQTIQYRERESDG